MASIINVSNRLPVTVDDDGGLRKSSGGLVAALEGLPGGEYDLKWIGWPGNVSEDPGERRALAARLESEVGCKPVFLDTRLAEGFYEGLSNSSIWPMLHNLITYLRYEPEWWEDYREANQRFADEVLSVAREGDLVWVHDYQLMLVPGMLRRARPDLRVGFFLHTPFPSSEVFRCHPRRAELLEGMLGADQIGFHTFGYLRHFRSAALRVLGTESEITRIRHAGHSTCLGVYPIGINADRFEAELDSPRHAEEKRRIRESFAGKRLVVSVERMDYTKGIVRRLRAIDAFLRECDDRDTIKFVFVSVPSRETVEQYRELRADVEARIGRLNGRYATLRNSPVHFIHGSVEFHELCALYAAADVAMVTPLFDGMNLVAKEYVAAKRDEPGVLLLSEFAGAAQELFNAVIVNPFDPDGVAEAIRQALVMPGGERRERMASMRARVMRYDAKAWASLFIDDLVRRPCATGVSDQAGTDEARAELAGAVATGRRVALFVDYDGTLREIEREPQLARPNTGVIDLLEGLRALPNVDVTIISGRSAADLDEWLGRYGFGLVAEHGASVRRPGATEWERLDLNVAYGWKDELLPVLCLFEQTTPGSFIEDKRTSLVWHYRRADPEFGQWKAQQLAGELAVLTANRPLEVRHGKKIVEVTATQVSKGSAVLRLLEDRKYDLVLTAGDDVTDESMFALDVPNLVSIKIGPGQTAARYRVPGPAAFRRLLLEAVRQGPAPA